MSGVNFKYIKDAREELEGFGFDTWNMSVSEIIKIYGGLIHPQGPNLNIIYDELSLYRETHIYDEINDRFVKPSELDGMKLLKVELNETNGLGYSTMLVAPVPTELQMKYYQLESDKHTEIYDAINDMYMSVRDLVDLELVRIEECRTQYTMIVKIKD